VTGDCLITFEPTERIPDPIWSTKPAAHPLLGARAFLALAPSCAEEVRQVIEAMTTTPVRWVAADSILDAAGLESLPMNDRAVKRAARLVRAGRALAPILAVVADEYMIVDGHYRVSVAYHRSPSASVPVIEAVLGSEGVTISEAEIEYGMVV
jgi:hypothetical protein